MLKMLNISCFRYTSPKSQLLITVLLTLIEVIINIVWFIFDQPRVINIYPSQDTKLRICAGLGDYSYLIGLAYPFILIGKLHATTVYFYHI